MIKRIWCLLFGHRWYGQGWSSSHLDVKIPRLPNGESEIRNFWKCDTCGKRTHTDGWRSKMEDVKTVGICYCCRKIKTKIKRYEWDTSPGTGTWGYFCSECWPSRPAGFQELMGISREQKKGAKFVKAIGQPRVTSCECGQINAWGSVLALYDDGSKLPYICQHGGSAWLCLSCAQEIIANQEKGMNKDLGTKETDAPSTT